jgi:DNA polymerase III epsilon subunit-like protein
MVVEFETYTLYNIDRIPPKCVKHDWYITCAAWGWLDNRKQKINKIETVAVNDFKTYKKDFRDDRLLVKKLHEVMSQADLIIGHNSDSFDIKKINYKFIKYGLQPLDLPATVDTLKVAKKYARATSNSLFYLAREFGVSMKIALAPGVMHAADSGCEKSLKKLVKYNIGDIRAGAELYFKLLPYIQNHPVIDKIMGRKILKKDKPNCQNCGSTNTQSNGHRTNKSGKYRRYKCNECGASTKGEKL